MNIKILSTAQKDLVAGYRFYEAQSAGLGNYFLDSLYADIESLAIYAGTHQRYFDGYYRLLSKKFPFAIYYKIEASEIRIYAILDCRRKPPEAII